MFENKMEKSASEASYIAYVYIEWKSSFLAAKFKNSKLENKKTFKNKKMRHILVIFKHSVIFLER